MEDIMRLATQRGDALQVRLGHRHRSVDAPLATARSSPAAAGPPGRCRSCGSTTRSPRSSRSGGKTRRAAKMQSLKVWHPDILEFIECKWKEEQKARCLIEKGGYEANFNGEAYSSILFQNANLSVRVTDEFMQAVERGRRLADPLGHRSGNSRPDLPGQADRWAGWPSAPGTAAIRACSTTPRSIAGTRAPTPGGSTPAIRAASTCSSTTRPATSPASTS